MRFSSTMNSVTLALLIGMGCFACEAPTAASKPKPNVTQAGGTLSLLNNRLSVTVPPGAVFQPLTMSVTAASVSAPTLFPESGFTVVTDPLISEFQAPLTLDFSLQDGSPPDGVRPTELALYRQAAGGEWIPAPFSQLSEDGATLRSLIISPGTYAILGTPAHTVRISPAVGTFTQGQSVDLLATALGGIDSLPLPDRPVVWTSSDPAVGTVTSAGRFTALTTGVTNVTAAVLGESVSATQSITVAVPPPAPSDNEPADFVLVTDRNWSSLATCGSSATRIAGWDDIEACNPTRVRLVSDSSAPRSPASVFNWTYPVGFIGGASPGTAQRILTGTNYTRIYLSTWVKLSANWDGHSSATNKMFFIWIAGQPRFFASAEGNGSNPLQPQLRMQNVPDTRARVLPNIVPNAVIQRGVWERWEFIVECNTPGAANGRAAWYINGVLVSDHRDILWNTATESCRWENVQLRPIWGGGGDQVTEEFNLSMDHIRISGKP